MKVWIDIGGMNKRKFLIKNKDKNLRKIIEVFNIKCCLFYFNIVVYSQKGIDSNKQEMASWDT